MAKRKTTDDTQQLYIAVHQERSSNHDGAYFHIRARICTQRYENHTWQPYGLNDDYDGPYYSNISITCQGDADSRVRDRETVYGFSCEYRDVYAIDARKAERMAKTLRAISTKLDKMTETRGYVRSFGEYVGRIAEAIGAKGIGVKRDQPSQYNNSTHDWLSIGDGANRINHLVWQWVEEGKPKAAETTDDAVSA